MVVVVVAVSVVGVVRIQFQHNYVNSVVQLVKKVVVVRSEYQ